MDSGGFGGFQLPSHVGINHGPGMADFIDGVQRTLVQQPDFRGIGGHGLQDSLAHGLHSQVSIGMGGGRTIDFRRFP